jgi:hypothetical protein
MTPRHLQPDYVPWNRESIVAGIRAFKKRTGNWPGYRDLRNSNGLPSQDGLRNNFVSLADANEAAGWERPPRALPSTKIPRQRGFMPVGPIRRVIREFMNETDATQTEVAVRIYGGPGKNFEGRIVALMLKQHWISFDLADKVLCRLDRASLWLTDPVLSEWYRRMELPEKCRICGGVHQADEEDEAA